MSRGPDGAQLQLFIADSNDPNRTVQLGPGLARLPALAQRQHPRTYESEHWRSV